METLTRNKPPEAQSESTASNTENRSHGLKKPGIQPPELADGKLGEIQKLLFGQQLSSNNEQLSSLQQYIDQQLAALRDDYAKYIADSQVRFNSMERRYLDDGYQRLAAIEKRLNDPASRIADIDEVIDPVLRKNLENENRLRKALNPVLVEQFHQTARQEPDVMAEALFPILGPAVRKMIANLLSPDKTSKRAYKLEQLLLIDKESGLPICQATSDTVVSRDADMVSGMLSAIQSFVHDAFSADEFDGLNTLKVGELSVWIEWGPSSVLAAVLRGAPPNHLREAMQIYLEHVHVDNEAALRHYSGDTDQFAHLKPGLLDLLSNHDGRLQTRFRNLSPTIKRWFVAGLIGLLFIVGWAFYDANDSRRWQRYIDGLNAIPGVLVLHHERGFRDYRIVGLKDPMASLPDTLSNLAGINASHITHQFESYQALHPALVLQRLRSVINVPADVTLLLEDSVLKISGNIDYQWLKLVRQYTASIAGINSVVYSGS